MRGLQVVYVHYRTVELVAASVASVLAAAGEVPSLELTVVDNSCDDAVFERLRAVLPAAVTLARMPDNVGFATACNHGAALGSASCLLFLNPDTVVPAGSLGALWRALETHGDGSLLGPRHYADESLRFWHAPIRATRLFDAAHDLLFARGFAPGRPRRYLEARWRLHARRGPIARATISGGCLALSRQTFAALGGFDESFWLYGEDVELCARARRRGARVLWFPEIPVVHYMERSSVQLPERVAASQRAGRARVKALQHGPRAARLEARIEGLLSRHLPRRSDPWAGLPDLPMAAIERTAPGVPWAIEIARSPLFDNCLTCFPEVDRLEPHDLPLRSLPPGRYHVRIADRIAGAFRERFRGLLAAPGAASTT